MPNEGALGQFRAHIPLFTSSKVPPTAPVRSGFRSHTIAPVLLPQMFCYRLRKLQLFHDFFISDGSIVSHSKQQFAIVARMDAPFLDLYNLAPGF
jgi:hypothetical protein